jgi:hypothetical protein
MTASYFHRNDTTQDPGLAEYFAELAAPYNILYRNVSNDDWRVH